MKETCFQNIRAVVMAQGIEKNIPNPRFSFVRQILTFSYLHFTRRYVIFNHVKELLLRHALTLTGFLDGKSDSVKVKFALVPFNFHSITT